MTVELPFRDNPTDVYRALEDLGQAVLLDSAGADRHGRWDILAAAPDSARSVHLHGTSSGEGLQLDLDRWLAETRELAPSAKHSPHDEHTLPFHGGYIGHLSYALGATLQGVPEQASRLPLAVIHYYPWAVVQDRSQRKSWLTGEPPPELARLLRSRLDGPAHGRDTEFRLRGSFRGPWNLDAYRSVFARVKEYIHAGDCYQINLGQAFAAAYEGDLLQAYEQLRGVARAPFSAFFPLDNEHTLMCLSPERFLTVDGKNVETRPIKGTRPRYTDARRDHEATRELQTSEKERAENLMIVDLMRNDISRFCEPGSVRVEEMFALETYATVHHLVSAVRGTLAAQHSAADLLLGSLPGGSITGAPKRRAMEIIRELEVAPRQAWCGSIFYLSKCGRMDSNITIRTLFNDGDELICWAGGGLVDDSEAAAEFQEQQHKVGAFISALEALGHE